MEIKQSRRFFENVVLASGQKAIDTDTGNEYRGDGTTPGGLLVEGDFVQGTAAQLAGKVYPAGTLIFNTDTGKTARSDGNTVYESLSITSGVSLAEVDARVQAVIDDGTPAADKVWSSDKVNTELSSAVLRADVKDPVATSTEGLGNITLSGEQTLNGVTTSTSRVAVVEQTDQTENGFYDTAAGAWTRTADAVLDAQVTNGMTAVVADASSTVYRHQYILTTANPITVGSSNLVFAAIPDIAFGTTAGTACEGNDARLSDARTPTAHTHTLSDVTDAGTAASHNVPASGDAASGEVVKGDDTRLTGALQSANNLSELAGSGATARSNLGLGDSATKNTGTGSGDVAAGDHTHTLADVTDSGDAAAKNTGTSAGTVAAGDDSRFPTTDQKAALDGAASPSASNPVATIAGLTAALPTAIEEANRGTPLYHMGWKKNQAFLAIGGDRSVFVRARDGVLEVIHPGNKILKLNISLAVSDDPNEPDLEVRTLDGRVTSAITGDNDVTGINGRRTVKGYNRRAMGCNEPPLAITSSF